MQLVWFLLGGYLVPALYFSVSLFCWDQREADEPHWLESLITAVLFGFSWPFQTGKFQSRQ